jgi:serine/threonine protein kinase
MKVAIAGKRVELRDDAKLGEGGEARVYMVELGGKQMAAKIYKGPDDASLVGGGSQDARNQEGARLRLEQCAEKLAAFPRGLPDRVLRPRELVHSLQGKTIGYVMDVVPDPDVMRRYSEVSFRQTGVNPQSVLDIFRELHATVESVHRAGVVIGDFNDLNVLVNLSKGPFLIDADSFQFGKFMCMSFTQRFADPLLCKPDESCLVLCKPHNSDSDWYAYAVMLFQSLLYVTPYDGIYKPKDKSRKIPREARPLKRITVLHPEVQYPKFASKVVTPAALPDDLMHEFDAVLHKDKRGAFPDGIIASMRWTKCSCGAEHARSVCPKCTAPGIIRSITEARGKVTAERIFKTSGAIVCAAAQDGSLRWLYHESNALRREGGQVVVQGPLDPRIRYRICGDKTCLAKGNMMLTIPGDGQPTVLDTFGVLPMYDANSKYRYWASGGRLLADSDTAGIVSTRTIGQIMQNQSLLWVGDTFGFGFYMAGQIHEFFVFDAISGMLRDGVTVPRLKGHLVDTTCVFSRDCCWFLAAYDDAGKAYCRCTMIDRQGSVLAHSEALAGEDSWLGAIRGKCGAGKLLFAATDDGIVRVERDGTNLAVTKRFPDTEPFVDSGCQLFNCQNGLHVVTRNEIRKLRMD